MKEPQLSIHEQTIKIKSIVMWYKYISADNHMTNKYFQLTNGSNSMVSTDMENKPKFNHGSDRNRGN